MTTELERLAVSIRAVADRASRGLVDRRALVESTLLAAVAQEHVLVVGPPGTAKSQAIRQIAEAVGDRYFEYLISKFTEPTELFGAVDLVELRAGRVVVDTTDLLPDAQLAFLDEIFLGSSAILNTLLGILNERVYRRGHTVRYCPLRICVGASNELPTDPTLAAFADRFLVRVFVERVADPFLEDLLTAGWAVSRPPTPADSEHTGGILDVAAAFVDQVDLSRARPVLAQAVRLLRRHGIELSDRRIVRSQRLVAAAAVLDGRTTATPADLWPIVSVIPTAEDQLRSEEILHELLAETHNRVATAAAEDASHGPARARRSTGGRGTRGLGGRSRRVAAAAPRRHRPGDRCLVRPDCPARTARRDPRADRRRTPIAVANGLTRIEWQPVEPPLAAVAVAGHGVVGQRLAARAEHEPRWMLLQFPDWSVVIGDGLPWVDGVTYLGALPATMELLVPVHWRPRLHADLVVRAVRSFAAGIGPVRVALIPERPGDTDGRVAVLPLGAQVGPT